MEKNGYSRRFAAAVTAASSVVGPIIPPSGIMILYAFVMNVSVAGLFAAGIVPGILITAGLMGITAFLARKRDYPVAARKATWSERRATLAETLPALMTPVILLGGILAGAFTPTEAAAIAAVYALVVSLFVMKSLTLADLPRIFISAAAQSGVILLLVGGGRDLRLDHHRLRDGRGDRRRHDGADGQSASPAPPVEHLPVHHRHVFWTPDPRS